MIDATVINETGKSGTSYRFHYSYSLPELSCDFTKLTPVKGQGNGESFKQFPVAVNDLCIADTGYSSFQGIEHVVNSGGDVCVRVNKQILHTHKLDGEKLDLHKWLFRKNMKAGQIEHTHCFVKGADESQHIQGRLCVIKKDKAAIKKAEADLKKNRTKSQLENIKSDTRFLRQFIILFTTLPEEQYDARKVLNMYRLRWQVELVFKRFKSLLSLGQLPKKTPESSEAWLYGKLFIALLIEKIIASNSAFPPWRDQVQSTKRQLVAYIRFCYSCCPGIDFTDDHLRYALQLME